MPASTTPAAPARHHECPASVHYVDDVNIGLRPVTMSNRRDLEKVDPGQEARGWVHSAWYWHQVSLERPEVTFRLIHADESERAVGMVAYGPAYRDEALSVVVPGWYELAHLVIDHRWQRRGIGRLVAESGLTVLAGLPDCARLLVCHHPANVASRALFTQLGFEDSAEVNYDGDPILVADAPAWLRGRVGRR